MKKISTLGIDLAKNLSFVIMRNENLTLRMSKVFDGHHLIPRRLRNDTNYYLFTKYNVYYRKLGSGVLPHHPRNRLCHDISHYAGRSTLVVF